MFKRHGFNGEISDKTDEKLDKTDNRGKTISSKLEMEFENYKKQIYETKKQTRNTI